MRYVAQREAQRSEDLEKEPDPAMPKAAAAPRHEKVEDGL
jgi:hypothetical protein